MSATIEKIGTAKAHETLVHDFFAAQDRLRGGPAEELCAPTYRACIGANPTTDRLGHEAFATGFYAGFPDAMHHVEFIVTGDDAAAVRLMLRGTHTGNFFGIPATGKPMEVAAHIFMSINDGRVERLTGLFDEAALLRQIGVLPVG